MLHSADVARIVAYGAQLDAWAAISSRHIGQALPKYATAMEIQREEELKHARLLAKLAPARLDVAYAEHLGQAVLSDRIDFNVALQNFVERRSEIQFRMAWHETRIGDLLEIANDEARHVRLGRQIMKELGVDESVIREVHEFVDASDSLCQPEDRKGLTRLNLRIAWELLEL